MAVVHYTPVLVGRDTSSSAPLLTRTCGRSTPAARCARIAGRLVRGAAPTIHYMRIYCSPLVGKVTWIFARSKGLSRFLLSFGGRFRALRPKPKGIGNVLENSLPTLSSRALLSANVFALRTIPASLALIVNTVKPLELRPFKGT